MLRKFGLSFSILSLVLLGFNIFLYESISPMLPVIRGINQPKTFFLSIRILVINIETLAAFLLLAKSIARIHCKQDTLEILGSCIIALIGMKMILEFLGMFFPSMTTWVYLPIIFGILGVFLLTALRCKQVFAKEFWEGVRFKLAEKILLVLLLCLYCAMNIPIMQHLVQ